MYLLYFILYDIFPKHNIRSRKTNCLCLSSLSSIYIPCFPFNFEETEKRTNYISYNIKIRLAKISFFSCIYKDAYTNLYSFVPFQIARERISSSKSPNFPLLLLRPSLFNEHRSVTRFCIHSCIMSKG